jgi:hypothetical protein
MVILSDGHVVIAGIGSLTQATMGVGLIAGGCYLGILSRIAQASHIANIDK